MAISVSIATRPACTETDSGCFVGSQEVARLIDESAPEGYDEIDIDLPLHAIARLETAERPIDWDGGGRRDYRSWKLRRRTQFRPN